MNGPIEMIVQSLNKGLDVKISKSSDLVDHLDHVNIDFGFMNKVLEPRKQRF